MKRRVPSFLAGVLTTLLAVAMATTALAASGAISYNGATVTVGGEAQAAGDITTAEGQAPGSIQFTDAAGNVTHYLPLETIGQLPGVDAVYDPATKTVKLERGNFWEKQETEKGVQYASEDTGISYDTAPSYAPAVLPEGWVLESIRASGGQEYRNGSGRISFTCSYPNGGSHGWMPGSGEIPCTTVTVNGCEAELYTHSSEYGDGCLLVWENLDGVLFWFVGSGVEPETLVNFASTVAPAVGTLPDYEAGWLPSGYSWFETNTSAGTVETTWIGEGGDGNITLTYSTSPLLLPEGTGKTVEFGDVAARFWEAEEPHEPSEGTITVGGEPVEGNQVDMGNVTVSVGTISGPGAADVATLAWTDADTGVHFRLHGTVDQDTLVRIARSVREK